MNDKTMPTPALLDIGAVAQALGVTERYVRKIIAERRIPVVKVGRLVRVRAADLDAYITANTRAAR